MSSFTIEHSSTDIFTQLIMQFQVHASHCICHPCWQRVDRVAKQVSAASRSTGSSNTSLKCVNCNINLLRMRRHILDNVTIRERLQQQVLPRLVSIKKIYFYLILSLKKYIKYFSNCLNSLSLDLINVKINYYLRIK